MSLAETIRNNFLQIIAENGTQVTNTKTNKNFIGLVSSGDFSASFLESDQDTELSIQVTMLAEDEPKTGEILLIGGKKYITQTVQSRVNGVISKATLYETKKTR